MSSVLARVSSVSVDAVSARESLKNCVGLLRFHGTGDIQTLHRY